MTDRPIVGVPSAALTWAIRAPQSGTAPTGTPSTDVSNAPVAGS